MVSSKFLDVLEILMAGNSEELLAAEGPFFFGASSGKRIGETVVPFMAGVFEYWSNGLLPWNFC
jgi:hypothetical protein